MTVDQPRFDSVPMVDVTSIDALVKLARKYDALIMDAPTPEGAAFLVWDNGMVFRYRATG